MLRQGDFAEVQNILTKMTRYFANEEKYKTFRGLLRVRRKLINSDYQAFLELAITHFTTGLAKEEFNRKDIPSIMHAVAECFKRSGKLTEARAWYLALTKIPEGKPALRQEIRAEGRLLNGAADVALHLAWQADDTVKKLSQKLGLEVTDGATSEHARLIAAIVHEGLGSLQYQSPNWNPRQSGEISELILLMDEIGKFLLLFHNRFGDWPDSLDELWETGLVSNRNKYNRFFDPINGERFVYNADRLRSLGAQAEHGRTVLLRTASPIQTKTQAGYGYFLQNLEQVFGNTLYEVGSVWQAQ